MAGRGIAVVWRGGRGWWPAGRWGAGAWSQFSGSGWRGGLVAGGCADGLEEVVAGGPQVKLEIDFAVAVVEVPAEGANSWAKTGSIIADLRL